MSGSVTIKSEAEPRHLAKAREILLGLQAVAASDNVFRRRAGELAGRLERVIEHNERNEMAVLRGEYAHLSSLAAWLRDYEYAIDFVLRDEGEAKAHAQSVAGMPA